MAVRALTPKSQWRAMKANMPPSNGASVVVRPGSAKEPMRLRFLNLEGRSPPQKVSQEQPPADHCQHCNQLSLAQPQEDVVLLPEEAEEEAPKGVHHSVNQEQRPIGQDSRAQLP